MATKQDDKTLAFAEINKRRQSFEKFYKYYKGEHALNYASEKYRNKFFDRLKSLNVNLCKRVVNAPVSRLEVINFATEKKNVELAAKAWAIWKRSKMPLKSKSLFREAFRVGEAYVLVWVNPLTKKAEFYPQSADTVKIWKDGETGATTKAAKLWRDGKKYYLTLYYPDRIEKYETGAYYQNTPTTIEGFKPRVVPGESFPLANPFGRVPIFELSPLESESLLSDVIPINDSLNKTVADIQAGGEYNTLNQRYIAGTAFETDPETGRPIVPYQHDDQVWTSENENAKFGQFPEIDLEKMLKVAAETKLAVAQVTGIPAHFFNLGTGDFPSGEALETAESPFISLVEDAQIAFGEGLGDAMNFALNIENVLKDSDEPVELTWQDPARPTLRKRLEIGVLKQSLGVSLEKIQSELGYTDDEIATFKTENATRATALGATLGGIFNQGDDLETDTVN